MRIGRGPASFALAGLAMLGMAAVGPGLLYFLAAGLVPGLTAAAFAQFGRWAESFAVNAFAAATGSAVGATVMVAMIDPRELDSNPLELAALYSIVVWVISMSGAGVIGLVAWAVWSRVRVR